MFLVSFNYFFVDNMERKIESSIVLYTDVLVKEFLGIQMIFCQEKIKAEVAIYSAPKILTLMDISSDSCSLVLPSVGMPSFWAVSRSISSLVFIVGAGWRAGAVAC